MRVNDLLLGVVMALLGVVVIWASRDFSALPRQHYGAGTFPTLIGSLLIALGALMALRGWQYQGALITWQGELSARRVTACIAVVIAAVGGYVLLTPVLGFPVVSLAMLTLMIGWLTAGRWVLAASVAVVATALVWLTFSELLHVPLSLGILEKVIY
ncbi:tripartite tricarboxylate transporter TctB family protein [Halomonas sp. HP20-15]|uniref:tripartite tricarboxylate transporter TctB family protein n=1 Tax=Halomonas sp. HP20-15 TaxID=3085901 RepID=UPI002982496C|nr:tripartite tricarboxylate transporter TctB family protein [Halomonas sp. HP20-15]MDW5377706.1 tripartite tricarboxylate transporter TctB family protein [Halomonas sp. HP20-15]